MRIDLTVEKLNPHFGIAKRTLKSLVDKWCKANLGAEADELHYRGPEGIITPTSFKYDCMAGNGRLTASVLKPSGELVTFVLKES